MSQSIRSKLLSIRAYHCAEFEMLQSVKMLATPPHLPLHGHDYSSAVQRATMLHEAFYKYLDEAIRFIDESSEQE